VEIPKLARYRQTLIDLSAFNMLATMHWSPIVRFGRNQIDARLDQLNQTTCVENTRVAQRATRVLRTVEGRFASRLDRLGR
jgi:hypothetical protein